MLDHQLLHDGEQKSLDSTSALEKVLRLDRRHTNFDYYDSIRSTNIRISYPQILTEGPSSETLLKSLWKHANTYYFKKIEDAQYDRLQYIESVLHSPNEGSHRFIAEQQFWNLIRNIFSEKYLQRYLIGERQKLEYHNWLEYMNLTWKVITNNDLKYVKKNRQSYEALQYNMRAIYKVDQVCEQFKLDLERVELEKFLEQENDFGDDEVSEQIRRLQREVEDSNDEIKEIFQNLKQKVQYQAAINQIIFCSNDSNTSQEPKIQFDKTQLVSMQRKLQKIKDFEAQTNYIEYIIQILQKKQIAQSVSKFYRLQKQKGQVKIHLHFQESMGIKPIIISQKQFQQINQLREYSLLKYYNTASKTRYSFICQNYFGFKDIFQNRNRPCRYKNRDILQQMKKNNLDSLNSGYYKQFNRMEICHHCKLLHHQENLISCEYRSSRHGNPIPQSPFFDSYVFQILKNEQSRASAIRSLNNTQLRKNSYFYYTKDNDEYTCERKFCKYCLKNYDDGKQKSNGLCPYCRGICYCTRCSRNQMIIRLKSMYILMGGDITRLQRCSIFEKYFQNSEDLMDLRKKDKGGKIQRKTFGTPNRMNQKMFNIRFQLEDLRILCDLVKRRQKGKQKLLGIQKKEFRQKMKDISSEFYLNKVGNMDSQDQKQQQNHIKIQLNQKLSKKLKRMIS